MNTNEQGFTDRQVEILEKLGSEYRDRIDSKKKNFIIIFSAIQVLIVAFAIGYFVATKTWTIPAMLGVLVIFEIFFLLRKKLQQYKELKESSNYNIGLYFAGGDKRVIGYADKKIALIEKITKYGAIICLVIGAFILYRAFSTKQIDKDGLSNMTTTISAISEESTYTYSEKNYSIKYYKLTLGDTSGDSSTFMVYSCYSYLSSRISDIEAILSDSSSAKSIKIYYNTSYTETYGFCDVYDITIDGVSFLSITDINENIKAANTKNYIIGGLIAALAVIIYCAKFLLKSLLYEKLRSGESIHLSYTEEETKALEDERQSKIEEDKKSVEERKNSIDPLEEESLKRVEIKTKPNMTRVITDAVIVLAGIGLLIYGIVSSTAYKTMMLFGGALIIVYALVKASDDLLSSATLNGDTVFVKKLFKESAVNVDDIQKVTLENNQYVFYDAAGNVLLSLKIEKEGSREIAINLVKRGIIDKAGLVENKETTSSSQGDVIEEATDSVDDLELDEMADLEENSDSDTNL